MMDSHKFVEEHELNVDDFFTYRNLHSNDEVYDDVSKISEFLLTAGIASSPDNFIPVLNAAFDSHLDSLSTAKDKLGFYQRFLKYEGLKPSKDILACHDDLVEVLTAEHRWLLRCQAEGLLYSSEAQLLKKDVCSNDEGTQCLSRKSTCVDYAYFRFNPERGFLEKKTGKSNEKSSTHRNLKLHMLDTHELVKSNEKRSHTMLNGDQDDNKYQNSFESSKPASSSLMERILQRRILADAENQKNHPIIEKITNISDQRIHYESLNQYENVEGNDSGVDNNHDQFLSRSRSTSSASVEVISENEVKSSAVTAESSKVVRLCRQCRYPCPKKTRSFCSSGCVHLYKLRSSSSHVRSSLLIRDGGVCQICHLDCEKLRRTFNSKLSKIGGTREIKQKFANTLAEVLGPPCPQRLKINRRGQLSRGNLWHADHIIAVCEGGGNSGLENFRTLCIQCHHEVTAELKRNRAQCNSRKKVLKKRIPVCPPDTQVPSAKDDFKDSSAQHKNSSNDSKNDTTLEETVLRTVERNSTEDSTLTKKNVSKVKCKRRKIGRWYRTGLGR